ncbi:tetratricopeptide repeat protein [Actinomadura sp. NAK00032]|uniref:tetratricopeptide repeat protein n=1 Tax=Actinomadura sp. NAK00032 TaxID=2742128 RepID=UPI001590FDDD|nr:tetratricopeptide repeat protein [Actinomadura sp. NAK00032]QKW38316.1 tetratricopeptide repeat protein [Actinomadura sp. NAK00032]
MPSEKRFPSNGFEGDAGTVIQAQSVQGGIRVGGGRDLPPPRQLPLDVAGFIDREASLRALDGLLTGSTTDGGPPAVVVSAVAGAPGVGKTALALRWAHRSRSRFPDGDLYVDMRGYGPGRQLTAGEALDGFLRALGAPPEAIPDETGQRASIYRTLLDGKRVLVVIDNAAASSDIRELLPASRGCFALITGRSTLAGLVAREGAARVTLDVLSPEESVALLATVIGADRVATDQAAALRVADLSGHLPLALRVVAEHAAGRPELSMAGLAGELEDERHRLDALAAGEDELSDVRAAFSWSYRALPEQQRRAFRLLGLHTGPDIGIGAAAALIGTGRAAAGRLLRALTAAHLLRETSNDRFQLHDLLRAYARERAAAGDPQGERTRAVRRMLAWYLLAADAGRRLVLPYSHSVPLVPPGGIDVPAFATAEEATRWFEQERSNLLAALRLAADLGQYDIAWKLPVVADGFFELGSYWADWEDVHRLGLRAARELADALGEASNVLCLGDAGWRAGRYDEALADYRRALLLARELGDGWLEGFASRGIGLIHEERHEIGDATGHFRTALRVFRDSGVRRGEGMALLSLGRCAAETGDREEAVGLCERALAVFAELGDEWSEAWGTLSLSSALLALERAPDAEPRLRRAAGVFERFGDRRSTAMALTSHGEALLAMDDPIGAADRWRMAATIYDELGDDRAAGLQTQAAALERRGDDD